MADFDAETRIEELASTAKSISVAGMSQTEVNIDDVIKADKHLARKKAATAGGLGIRMGVMRAPGQY